VHKSNDYRRGTRIQPHTQKNDKKQKKTKENKKKQKKQKNKKTIR